MLIEERCFSMMKVYDARPETGLMGRREEDKSPQTDKTAAVGRHEPPIDLCLTTKHSVTLPQYMGK